MPEDSIGTGPKPARLPLAQLQGLSKQTAAQIQGCKLPTYSCMMAGRWRPSLQQYQVSFGQRQTACAMDLSLLDAHQYSGASGDKAMDGIRDQLSVMSLPEQLFGDNYLQLTSQLHGLQLSFSAFPALAAWHQEALPPVQVAAAQQWSQSREQDIQAHQPLRFNYDWCASLPAGFSSLLTCNVCLN